MGIANATRLGELLNDAYELKELESATGPLEVYRATDKRTRTGVRVKLLRPEFALQSGVVEKFLKGPRFLSAMTHSSLPSVRIDTDDTGIPFVVEEVVDGRELSSLIDGFPQGLPLPLVAKVIVPLVEVLALAHESGVVHGAIDVQRVKLLGPAHEPSPKLLDFGVPASERTPAEDAYRAPELSSSDAGSEQGDVFAMGVLLYVMLSGTLPFRSGKKSAMPLDEVAPQVPQEWVELTTACLEPQTTKRLADASVLLKKLRHCAGERSSVSRVKAIDQTADASFEDTAPEEEPKESKSAKEVKSAKEAHDVKVSMAATMLAMPAPVVSAPATPDEKETVADPVIAKPEAKHEPKAEAKADAKADAKAEPPVISSLANVFGSAEESEKKDKKSAAKEAADKLKSKAKHHDRDSHVEARDKEHEHKHDPKHDHKHDPKHDKDKPRESKVTVRHGDRESKVDSERPAPAKHEPGKRATPPAGSPRPKTAGPTQGQIAAVALTDAQLNALRGMRTKNTEERDRWVGLIFLLLFMLMLQLGIPLLYEPHMTRAHVLFGPRLNIVAGAFSMVTIVATARMWFAQVQARSPIDRVTSFTLQVVCGCVVLVALTLFTESPAVAMIAGGARKALPWALSALFFMYAFGFGMKGARHIASNMLYGALVMMMSVGSLYGSYHAIFATLLKDRKLTPAEIAAIRERRAHGMELPGDAERLKEQLADKTSMTDWTEQHSDVNDMQQRNEVGSNEADDLKATEELQNTRNKNKDTLDKLQTALPMPAGVADKKPPPAP